MTDLTFAALEYTADDGFAAVQMGFHGSTEEGFTVRRNGEDWVEVGPGYRVLQTVAAGVCATDLDRRFLPFRLPQITGHEVLAAEPGGTRRFALEINASRLVRGDRQACADCQPGFDRHCPSRLVLGIHDLPGGFGPYVLCPVHALVEVPEAIPTATAVLMEPLAAAMRVLDRIELRDGDRVAVLGPRRLGMLIIAALASKRRTEGMAFEITALVRRDALRPTAMTVGADRVELVGPSTKADAGPRFDIVIDTTGSPEGMELACGWAGRELHLKSTHGQPAGGLRHSTAMVVDEVSLHPWGDGALPGSPAGERRPRVAWASTAPIPESWSRSADTWTTKDSSPEGLVRLRTEIGSVDGGCIVGADIVVIDTLAQLDGVLRPSDADELSLVRPLGHVVLRQPLGEAPVERLLARGARLSTSRCGDFTATLARMVEDPALQRLGETFVTHEFRQAELAQAFRTARGKDCLKAVVHPG